MSAPAQPTQRLTIIVVAALLARAITIGNPILHIDEEFYFTTARAMAHGAIPYVDVWDRKPIGLFLLYLPAALFPAWIGVYVYQSLALGCVVATAYTLAGIADLAGWRRGATAGALLYIFWLNLADGQGGQAPVFYNLAMAVAALAVGRAIDAADDRARRRHAIVAIALSGVALQIKYSVVFEGAFFGVCLIVLHMRARPGAMQALRYAIGLCLIALVPTLLAIAVYALIGHADAFVFANFVSILLRHPDPAAMQIENIVASAALIGPLIVLATVGWIVGPIDDAPRLQQRFVRAWFAVAISGFLVFGTWFNHYSLPVMLPGAVCAAAVFAQRAWGRILALPVLAAAFIAGQMLLRVERERRGTPAQFRAIVDAVGTGPGSLYVYSGQPMLYAFTGRPATSRYILPLHLLSARETGAIGVDQVAEERRILDRHPAVIVADQHDPEEVPAVRASFDRRLVQRDYRRTAILPLGRTLVSVFRRVSRDDLPPLADR